jgi:hypothetical protein
MYISDAWGPRFNPEHPAKKFTQMPLSNKSQSVAFFTQHPALEGIHQKPPQSPLLGFQTEQKRKTKRERERGWKEERRNSRHFV